MAYDKTISARIDKLIRNKKNFTQKKLIGGVGYMYNGNICIGVYKDELLIRCFPEETDALIARKNVRAFDITSKPMKGWLLVSKDGIKGRDLQKWFEKSLAFVQTLPKK